MYFGKISITEINPKLIALVISLIVFFTVGGGEDCLHNEDLNGSRENNPGSKYSKPGE